MSLYKRTKDATPAPLAAGLTAWAVVFGFFATCNVIALLVNTVAS